MVHRPNKFRLLYLKWEFEKVFVILLIFGTIYIFVLSSLQFLYDFILFYCTCNIEGLCDTVTMVKEFPLINLCTLWN